MDLLGQMLLSSIYVGSLYGLVAVGYTVLFRAGGILNFAQSGLMVLAAFTTTSFLTASGKGLVPAILISVTITAALSTAMYLGLLRRLTGLDHLGLTILTMGASISIASLTVIGWGTDPRRLPLFQHERSVHIVGFGRTSLSQITAVVVSLVAFALLFAFFRYTRVGLQLRAASENPDLASRNGISVGRLYAVAWLISGVAAAVAGILLAGNTSVTSGLGDIGLIAFPAAVVGGFGNVPGALVGGLIIGVVQQGCAYYIDASIGDTAVYLVLLAVLLVRPWGLFGKPALIRS